MIWRTNKENLISAEEVLLQISLAFLILLGFLLSCETNKKTALQEVFRDVDKQIETLAKSSKCDIAAEAHKARISEQKWRLWLAWENKIKAEHIFFHTLIILEERDSVLGVINGDALRKNHIFNEFRRETLRIFLGHQSDSTLKNPLTTEVRHLVERTLEVAGLAFPHNRSDLDKWLTDPIARKAQAFFRERSPFDMKVASPENLHFIADVIYKDLVEARTRAVKIQVIAVTKIAEAKVLHDDALQNDPSSALQVLEKVVSELDKPLWLLPEVKNLLIAG